MGGEGQISLRGACTPFSFSGRSPSRLVLACGSEANSGPHSETKTYPSFTQHLDSCQRSCHLRQYLRILTRYCACPATTHVQLRTFLESERYRFSYMSWSPKSLFQSKRQPSVTNGTSTLQLLSNACSPNASAPTSLPYSSRSSQLTIRCKFELGFATCLQIFKINPMVLLTESPSISELTNAAIVDQSRCSSNLHAARALARYSATAKFVTSPKLSSMSVLMRCANTFAPSVLY